MSYILEMFYDVYNFHTYQTWLYYYKSLLINYYLNFKYIYFINKLQKS